MVKGYHWAVKELGTSDLYQQNLKHNSNGRFVVACGDGEYIIYTAMAWRNRSFGSAWKFVWSSEGEYAVRENTSKIKIFSKTLQGSKNPQLQDCTKFARGSNEGKSCDNELDKLLVR